MPVSPSTQTSMSPSPSTPTEQGFCTICRELDEAINLNKLQCPHSFHSTCIDSWISRQGASATCPNCRTPIASNERLPTVSTNNHVINEQRIHERRQIFNDILRGLGISVVMNSVVRVCALDRMEMNYMTRTAIGVAMNSIFLVTYLKYRQIARMIN